MASSQHIAFLRANSMDEIKEVTEDLGQLLENVEVPNLDRVSGRNNPDHRHAQQLELLAGAFKQTRNAVQQLKVAHDQQVEDLEGKLQAGEQALTDQKEMADSIIRDHQGYVQKLELQLTDAQTQLLDLTAKLEARAAELEAATAKPKGNEQQQQQSKGRQQ